MKAGVVHAREDIRYEEIEKPVPKKGQVLIKVEFVDQMFHVSMEMHVISSRMYWDMNSREQLKK